MPSASEWEKIAAGHDDLGALPRDRATLEAEVRRLRYEMLRVADLAREANSWTKCRIACERIALVAQRALEWKR